MRVSKDLKSYFIKTALVGLYSIFLATQLFSITPDTAANTGTISFFPNQVHRSTANIITSANKISITQKNIVGFRLNKRFHPAEWFFVHIPCIESTISHANNAVKKSFFKEPSLSSAFLLFELLRGPPAVV